MIFGGGWGWRVAADGRKDAKKGWKLLQWTRWLFCWLKYYYYPLKLRLLPFILKFRVKKGNRLLRRWRRKQKRKENQLILLCRCKLVNKGNSSLCGDDDSVFMMMIVIIFLVYLQGRENVKPKKTTWSSYRHDQKWSRNAYALYAKPVKWNMNIKKRNETTIPPTKEI